MAIEKHSPAVVAGYQETQADVGPPFSPKYRIHVDRPGMWRWVSGDASADDTYTTLEPSGGSDGAWHLIGEIDAGTALTDASATIHVTGGKWRRLPASTLSANRTLTLGTTNARAGYRLLITRLDVGAYTYAIANGGSGAGTLLTMPVSSRYWAEFYFDGTDWLLRAGGAIAA